MSGENKTIEEDVLSEEASQEQDINEASNEESVDAAEETPEAVQAAEDEAKRWQDQYMRAEAEMVNLRRRVEKDVENAHKFGQEKFSKELLSVADNLERAILSTEGDTANVESIREGVEMTLKGLLDTFKKFNIEEVNPEGEPFDPQVHQAMSMVENPDVEPNTVIAVMQKGYLLHGRLIRPAMVMVSKGGGKQSIDEQA